MAERFKNKYRIPSIRLPHWDYGWNGAYFITICTKNRACYFGALENGEMILSGIGRIALNFWKEIPNHFSFVVLDEFVIMPNHIHGIIIIDKRDNGKTNESTVLVETRHCLVSTTTPVQNRFRNPGSNNISSIVGSYKSVVSKNAHRINKIFAWQPRFYDRIIRGEREFRRIRQYIRSNPQKWEYDSNNRDRLRTS